MPNNSKIIITEQGAYDMSMEDYHSDCCDGPSVSSSGLKKIIECPAKFWMHSYLNPNAIVQKDTKALVLGKAAHDALYFGKLPDDLYHILPDDLSLNSNAGKDVLKYAKEAGQMTLKRSEANHILAMAKKLNELPIARAALLQGEKEKSLFWKDKETGIWLKVRPDVIPPKKSRLSAIPDYKTALSAKLEDFSRDIYTYGYHMSAALYLRGVKEVLGRKFTKFVFVVQEKTDPYVISVFQLSHQDILWGEVLVRKAIHTLADCLENDYWPGYYEDIQEVSMPGYAQNQLTIAEEKGLFDVKEKR